MKKRSKQKIAAVSGFIMMTIMILLETEFGIVNFFLQAIRSASGIIFVHFVWELKKKPETGIDFLIDKFIIRDDHGWECPIEYELKDNENCMGYGTTEKHDCITCWKEALKNTD